MKKLTVMLLVMTLVFGLAACGNASEKGSTVTETQAQSAEDTGAGNAELNKLYEKENAIIAKHQELWNTVFNNIDKNKSIGVPTNIFLPSFLPYIFFNFLRHTVKEKITRKICSKSYGFISKSNHTINTYFSNKI